jgi:hypothetical protein
LTDIYLCHACSCHEILSGNGAAGGAFAQMLDARGQQASAALSDVQAKHQSVVAL